MVEVAVKKSPSGAQKRKAAKARAANAEADSRQVAALLLLLLQSIAIQALGPEAGFLPQERAMLEDPLTRVLGRLDKGAMERVQTFADPALLIFGLVMWGARLAAIGAARRDARRNSNPGATPPAPVSPDAQGELVSAFPIGIGLDGLGE